MIFFPNHISICSNILNALQDITHMTEPMQNNPKLDIKKSFSSQCLVPCNADLWQIRQAKKQNLLDMNHPSNVTS